MNEQMTDEPQFPEAELARLADGSLCASRQAELLVEVKRSPELTRALSEQERAIAMLRSADVPAPDSLRMRVEDQVRAAAAPRRRRRFRLGGTLPGTTALVAVAAVAAVVIVLLRGGGAAIGPSLRQTALLALAPATMPAPPEASTNTPSLNLSTAGIPFPYWEQSVGWRAIGTRADTLSGRRIVTVFYAGRGGNRVGYTIVPDAPVSVRGGFSVTRDGVAFRLLRDGSARFVTWLRSGHTCVIAGREVSDRTLVMLATAGIRQRSVTDPRGPNGGQELSIFLPDGASTYQSAPNHLLPWP